jgi:tetratricopeptide (TPR) repeat protein
VLNYNFSWQLSYDLAKPILLPKGTRIQCTAHFDNSANNPNNPDPAKDVTWGDQSFDEMMIGFFSVAFDANLPLKSLTAEPAKEATKPRPKSPKELEALRAVQDAQTPGQQLQAIENVLTNFADTEFKVMLLQTAMQIEQRKDDFAQLLFYGERLLNADPKGAFALVTMASETARHTRPFDLDKEQKLAKVDQLAKAGLEAAKVMQWEAAKRDFESQAYEAMGQAAALRQKYDEAIADYKQSISVAATPNAVLWTRLGQAYEDTGKLDDASDAFDKALATPNISPAVKSVAQAKKDEVAKRKGAGSK